MTYQPKLLHAITRALTLKPAQNCAKAEKSFQENRYLVTIDCLLKRITFAYISLQIV